MNDVVAVIKTYEESPFGYEEFIYKTNDYYNIYEKMMELTDEDHEVSENAASWCEDAPIGNIFEFKEGEIEIQDID